MAGAIHFVGGKVMYVQTSRVKIYEGLLKEATDLFRESVLPVVVKQPGFIRFYLFSDPVNHEILIQNFWQRSEDIEELQISGFYQAQVKKFQGIFASAPERQVYELALEYVS